MLNYYKVGTDVVVGGALGAGDQALQNWDDDRESKAGARISMWKLAGTYYNYALPILAIVLSAMNTLRGDMQTRAITAGAQLVGRKGVWQATKRKASTVPWRKWSGDEPTPQPSPKVGLEF